MRRFCGVLGALMLVSLPVYVAAQAAKPADKAPAKSEQAAKPATEKAQAAKPATEKAPAAKAMTASGAVTAVSADSLTIKGKTEEMTFAVDKTTKVIATGASHKTDTLKTEAKPTVITEFVKVGDNVSVTYHEKDGTKHAASVRVRAAKPAVK